MPPTIYARFNEILINSASGATEKTIGHNALKELYWHQAGLKPHILHQKAKQD
jgi:hypothetical protein